MNPPTEVNSLHVRLDEDTGTGWHSKGKMAKSGTCYELRTPPEGRDKSGSPLVVCIHGIGAYSCHFDGLATILAANGYTTLCYDLLGMGRSKFPNPPFMADGVTSICSGQGHVDQLRSLMVELNFHSRPYYLIAHSMGGAIASLYAAQFKEEIAGLVLLSPAGLMDMGVINFLRSPCLSCIRCCVKSHMKGNQKDVKFMISLGDFVNESSTVCIEESTKIVEQHLQRDEPFEALWACFLNFPLGGPFTAADRKTT